MAIENILLKTLRQLPLNKQQDVLAFTQSLTETGQNSFDAMTNYEQAEDWLRFMESQPKDTP
jgi:hypothetical protein